MEETVPVSEHKRIKNCLEEEIKRKDGIIDSLRKETALILKSAIKQAEEKLKSNEELEKLRKTHKSLLLKIRKN